MATGKYGAALAFNGANAWVTINAAPSLGVAGAMTIEAWVNPSNGSGWRTVLLQETSGNLAYALYSANSASRPAGYVRTTAEASVTGTAAVALNTWTHLALTYNGSALRFYRDGTLVRTTATTGVIAPERDRCGSAGIPSGVRYFAGTIDEVRVYNRALTATEIQVDMATPVGGATPPDTTPPSASVTAPAQGAIVSGIVTLQASASDDVQVAGVRFLVDGGAIGSEDTSAPYSAGLDTRTLSNGSHTIAVLARDASGNQATSPAVTVTVDNPPQLVITSPAQGQTVPGTTLGITYTTVGDLNGVDHVHFRLNANPEVMDLTLDGVYQMANVPAGASILYGWLVRANHSKIPGTDAVPVSFSASGPDTTPPLVIVTAPSGGATVAGVVQVTAEATDAGGVAGVQFLLDGVESRRRGFDRSVRDRVGHGNGHDRESHAGRRRARRGRQHHTGGRCPRHRGAG